MFNLLFVVGPLLVHKRQKGRRALKIILVVFILLISIFLAFKSMKLDSGINMGSLLEIPKDGSSDNLKKSLYDTTSSPRLSHGKCGLLEPCPQDHFAFKLISGAANIIGPKMCLEGEMLIDGLKKNGGHGINIAVVNGQTGELINTGAFDMWGGDVKHLIDFLKSIKDGSLVLMASFDDSATKLNDEARTLIKELGSSFIPTLGFRDNWIFVGGKGIQNMEHFEKHIKNERTVNKYDAWPELLDMEGCIPRKQD